MKWDIKRIIIILKSMGGYFWLPLIVLYIILPIYQQSYFLIFVDLEEQQREFFEISQIFLPVLGIWWQFFVFRTLIENEGKEVIYGCDHKAKIRFVYWMFIIYQLLLLPTYVYYQIKFPDAYLEIMRLVLQTLVLITAFYCLAYLFSSSVIGFLLVFVYCMIALFVQEQVDFISIFSLGNLAREVSIFKVIIQIILIIIFNIGGVIFEKRIFIKK